MILVQDKEAVQYFGYGANSSSEMIEAIMGRRPSGFPAILEGYELFIQSWEEIPQDVRRILSNDWGSNFKTYCIRAARGRKVYGYVWNITQEERERISNWEFWYEPVKVKVKQRNGKLITVETEIIDNFQIGKVVNTEQYPVFLNDQKQMVKIAKKVRTSGVN